VQAYFAGFHPLAFVFGTLFLRLPVIPPVFAGTPYSIVNGAMWTIPIEFACYLGVLALGFIGGLKRTFCLIVTLALLGLCAFEKLFVHQLGFISHFSLDLAAYFSVGCCFYIFRDAIRFTNAIAALSGLVLFFCLFSFRLHQLAFSLCGAYLLFYLAFAKIRPLESFNQLPDVSYGVYLYGWPIQKLIIWWFPACSPWLLFFVSAVAAIAAGWASWNLVEKRFMLPKRPATLPASATVKENLAKPALNAE
jgi:peptidoglycan/LPS O-acetylase OafA/YrhL